MRITTWNMAYWSHHRSHERAWRWVLEQHAPDILLCQECAPPDWVREKWSVHWEPAYPTSRGQRWGTGVVTRLPSAATRMTDMDHWFRSIPDRVPGQDDLAGIHRADGWVTTVNVSPPGRSPVLVVSVHSPSYPIEKRRLSGIDVGAMRLQKSPDLWLLDVLFWFLKPRLGSGLVVGGDFNYSRLLDHPAERGNAEFFDRVAREGFVSLHRRFHEHDDRTFFQENKGPHQLDYLYADDLGARCVRRCEVVPRDEVAQLSDHSPLFADFD